MASISDLAPELLSLIAEYANCEPSLMVKLRRDPSYSGVHNLSTPSIRELCRVSQRFHAASVPVLYRSVAIDERVRSLFANAEGHPSEERGFALFRAHTKDVRVTVPPDFLLLTRLLSSLPRLEKIRWVRESGFSPGLDHFITSGNLIPPAELTATSPWTKLYSLIIRSSYQDDEVEILPCISTSSRLRVLHLTTFPDAKQISNLLIEGRMPPLEKLVLQSIRAHLFLNQETSIWDWSALVHLEICPFFFLFVPKGPLRGISRLQTFITRGNPPLTDYTLSTEFLSKFLGRITGLEHLELCCSIRDLDNSIFKNHRDTLRFVGIRDFARNGTSPRDIPRVDPDMLDFLNRSCPSLMEIQLDMTIITQPSTNSRPPRRKTAGRTIKTGGFDTYWDMTIELRSQKTIEKLCRFRNLRRLTLCVWVSPRDPHRLPAASQARGPVQKVVDRLVGAKEGVPFEQINVHAAFWLPMESAPDISDISDQSSTVPRDLDKEVHFIYDTDPHPTAPVTYPSSGKTKIYL